ncbi:putative LsmAD domain, ataxin 2, SM domain-containing protein [Septoria linicola]|nr:putative LsmAD domain, ataxin 2, SM domain-containing protein [Septoria linicola]
MSAATMNGSDAGKSTPANNAAGGSKQQLKSSVTGKALASTRKQAGSPIDGQNKKIAWDNTNATIRNANGNATPPSPAPAQNQNRQLHGRTVFLYSQMVGQDVTVTLTSGEQFTGVYSGTSDTLEHHTIKMARRTRQAGHAQTNGTAASDFSGSGPDYELSISVDDVADVAVQSLKLAMTPTARQNGVVGFQTDTQISALESRFQGERQLQKWQADSSTDVDLSLGTSTGGDWDQFAVNETKYGVKTDYNEDMYTTSIDRSNPKYRQQELEAARIAAEIEGSAPANAHIAEERRRDADRDDAGGDEEDKYSGVRRESSLPKRAAGAYVLPSQRPMTGAPTVSGAPFDPAIISSEIKIKGTSTSPAIAMPADVPPAANKPAEPQAPAVANVSITSQGPENHVAAARDAFKQFANNEKLRIKQAQDAKRNNVRQEKNVKLNDLKKFAANFKLKSRVPDDLVPILAKDHEKQQEIQKKAEQAFKEAELRSKDKDANKPTGADSPAQSSSTSQAGPASSVLPSFTQASHKQLATGPVPGQGQSPRASTNAPFRPMFRPQPLPTNLRMPSGPQPSAESPLSPASATSSRALNVKAPEFKFQPGASSFNPGTSSSPANTASAVGPSPSTPNQPIPQFFDAKKTKETVPLTELYDAITFLVGGDYNEEQKKKFVRNGGIPYSYDTPVTWGTTKANENVSHDSLFPQPRQLSQGPSPMQANLPHNMASQMPQHGMQVPVMQGGHPRQPFYAPQGAHMPGFPGPNMPGQFPQHNNAQNSPRIQHMPPFNGQVPMQPFQGQGIPGYGASPSMGQRQPMPPGGMMPYQQGPMMPQPRPGYQGHGFPPQQMGGHMMMQNPSQGGYNGPMPGFSPMPHQAQPHMPYQQQHGQGNFVQGSPRPHPMSQQGSQQGYQPHPPPGGQHPMHFQRAMSGGYPQMTPRQQAAMPHHGSPGMGPAQGDEGK